MKRLNTIVPLALAELIRHAPLCPEKVAFAWQAAVGPAIDRATTAVLGEGGALEVKTTDAAWQRELKRSSPLILERLARLLGPGVVTRLKVVSPDPARPKRAAGRTPAIPRKRKSTRPAR